MWIVCYGLFCWLLSVVLSMVNVWDFFLFCIFNRLVKSWFRCLVFGVCKKWVIVECVLVIGCSKEIMLENLWNVFIVRKGVRVKISFGLWLGFL